MLAIKSRNQASSGKHTIDHQRVEILHTISRPSELPLCVELHEPPRRSGKLTESLHGKVRFGRPSERQEVDPSSCSIYEVPEFERRVSFLLSNNVRWNIWGGRSSVG